MKALILELTKVDSIQQDVLSRHAGHHLRREHKPFLKPQWTTMLCRDGSFQSRRGIQVLLRWELTNFNDPHAKTMNGPVEGHVSYWHRSRQISFFAIGQRGVVYTSKPFSFWPTTHHPQCPWVSILPCTAWPSHGSNSRLLSPGSLAQLASFETRLPPPNWRSSSSKMAMQNCWVGFHKEKCTWNMWNIR